MRYDVLCLAALVLLCTQASAQENVILQLVDTRVSVLGGDGTPLESFVDDYPKVVLDGTTLLDDHTVEISVAVKDQSGSTFKPQQVMLLLVSQSTEAAAYVVGKAKRDGTHTLTISHAILEKQVGKLGGDYEVVLLVGDPAAAAGLTWKVGSISVLVDKDAPAAPALTATTQRHVFTLPEIVHQHRQPGSQPPAVLSYAFAALALGCLGGLVVALLAIVGVNFKAFPSGAGGLYTLLFHGGIAAMLGLYLAFWVQLDLMQTLPIAAIIGVFIVGTGYKSLSALADARIEESKKKKE